MYTVFAEESNPPFRNLAEKTWCCLALTCPPEGLLNTSGTLYCLARLNQPLYYPYPYYTILSCCHKTKYRCQNLQLNIGFFLYDNYVKNVSYT
jgi:hypothetical protein